MWSTACLFRSFRLAGSSCEAFARGDRIGHQHGNRHRANASGHRRDRGASVCDRVEVHVSDDAVSFGRMRVLDAVDADIDDDRILANVIRAKEMRTADCGDDDIRARV